MSEQLEVVLRHVRRLVGDEGGPRPTDAQLLHQFLTRRDEAAFAALVQRHGPMVLGVCRHVLHHDHDAEDAFQATFLVLARRAGSIRRRTSLASWLHGVAYRTSLCARRAARRRRDRAAAAHAPAPPNPAAELTWREVKQVLEQEIERLPEKYRGAFLLCCQEGRGRSEAARQLGLKEGTLASRLDMARKLLQRRLSRRGISLAVLLSAAALTDRAVSAELLEHTLGGLSGASSLPVVALANSAGRTALPGPVKVAGLLLALLALAAGAVAGQALLQPAPPTPQAGPVAKQEDPRPATDAQGDPLPEGALFRLGTTRFRQEGSIQNMILGPGGKTVLTCSRNHTRLSFDPGDRSLLLWDAESGKPLRKFARNKKNTAADLLRQAAYSRDGRLVAAGFNNGIVVIWDAATGEQLREIGDPKLDPFGLVFSGDGGTLFVFSYREKPIRRYEVATGKHLGALPGNYQTYRLAVSTDGKTLAGAILENKAYQIALWDAGTGQRLRAFRAPGTVEDLAFSADDKYLASASTDGTACVYEVATGKRRHQLRYGGKLWVYPVAFAPDGKTLASGGTDRRIRFWDVETGKETGHIDHALTTPVALAYTPDGKRLASAGGSAVHLWDVASGRPVHPAQGHQSRLEAVAHSPTAALLASAGDDRVIILWDTTTGKEVRRLTGHGFNISALAFSPDGKRLASGGNNSDASVRVWDVATGKQLAHFDGHAYVTHLRFSPDGKRLVSGDALDSTVRVWQLVGEDGTALSGDKALRVEKLSEQRVSGMALSPDTRFVAWAEEPKVMFTGIDVGPKTVHLRDLTTGKDVLAFEGHRGSQLRSMRFSPDGKVFASAGNGFGDQDVHLWDAATGKELRRIKVLGERLAFSADGRTLATAGLFDATVRLWEVATGLERGQFQGHTGCVFSLGFSADGRVVSSASDDTTIVLWDVTGRAGRRPAALTAKDLDGLWRDLSGKDGRAAYRAIWRLAAAPGQALPMLRKRVLPDAGRVKSLLEGLSSEQFATRQKAAQQLEDDFEQAEPALRAVLKRQPSVETRRRVEGLLEKGEARAWRVLEVLEYTGTPEAVEVLRALAAGGEAGLLTQGARAALQRLEKRGDPPFR
jgi:RNA polymerase sigma factor (sigma-70 family)